MAGSTTASLTIVPLACAIGVSFAQAGMTQAEVDAARERIDAEYRVEKTLCDEQLTDLAQTICVVEARGRQKIADARLEHRRRGGGADGARLLERARIEAEHDTAIARCDDFTSARRDECLSEAEAAKARAEARVNSTSAR